ncbi:MAG: magnesium chelatase [Bacteroidetes bacterium GWF2_38_335]|nr:MAG: magnesium chelatase [Bacteroidetes bacterium GWF2_38_335]OFY79839.1 MAG: magnesium chelatase [Bacteroidetes bacterium RIFOXYA12_FULL_38_20]
MMYGGAANPGIARIREMVQKIRTELHKVVVGQDEMIDLMLVGLFTNGHILLEGVPGIAKTVSAKLLAKSISTGFSRMQFTPDLMPTDIVGTSIFNLKTSEFNFVKGPVFSNIVLIDEINRSPAKTQAALFEVMEERQVTVDGTTYKMGFPFMVLATQNPIEQEGTYKLPEAQLDRFLFRVKLKYPSLSEEIQILTRFREDFSSNVINTVNPVISPDEIKYCQSEVEKIFIKDELIKYIAAIVDSTRNNPELFLGASPRASLSIMKSAKALAAINGRGFVTPDDIQYVAVPVMNHRMILSPEVELEGTEIEDVIKSVIKKIEVPR